MFMNRVILAGYLGRDPDLSYSTSGKPLAKTSLAVSRGKADGKDRGTDWIDLVFFGKTAEVVVEYAHKGDPLLVEGSLRINNYEKDGEKRRSINVTVMNVQFLKPKDKNGPGSGGPDKQAPEPAQEDDVPF